MLINRQIQPLLIEMAGSFPVVTVTGPRQSGKTTLVQMVFPDKDYVSLEDIDKRSFAKHDPRGFLSNFPHGAIIDEVQHVPEILSYIQTITDKQKKNGMFILTGSNQFQYMKSISQTLAGRTGLLKLLPFSYEEIYKNKYINSNEVIFNGFYPRIFDQKIKPELFYSAYLETYVQRDVRLLLEIKDLMQFHTFVKLCAGRTGQILNYNSLANEVGVTNKTIKHWISVLKASYIIFLLNPFHKNFNKRIIKSPKIYFIDVGLASHLLNIENHKQLQTHPLRGELFETFIVAEFLKLRYNQGKQDNLYFFRDQSGNEVDLILETGNGQDIIEIKSGKTVQQKFFKGLNYYKKMDTNVHKSCLIIDDDIKEKRTDSIVYGYPFINKI